MKTEDCTTYTDNKRLAVRIWLDNIPSASFESTASRIPISSVINHVAPHEPCTMARSSGKSLATLGSSGTIVFLTPVVLPAAAGKAANKTSPNTDPFETLGRAFSRYHKRIRHVPYHPSLGFTETHDAFVSQADAVIVVICEPQQAKRESLTNQIEFAENANEAFKESMGERRLRHPVTLVQCGDSQGNWWPDNNAFGTVLKCRSYDAETAQHVARKLFGK